MHTVQSVRINNVNLQLILKMKNLDTNLFQISHEFREQLQAKSLYFLELQLSVDPRLVGQTCVFVVKQFQKCLGVVGMAHLHMGSWQKSVGCEVAK